MAWLWEGWLDSQTPRALLFAFDALILAILAVGSAYGARTIFRLRRQVAEARQLGSVSPQTGASAPAEWRRSTWPSTSSLSCPCAVKLIRPGVGTDPRAIQRLEREVRLTARLSHPNTVEVPPDYGRTEDGTYHYVMEHLKGLSLDKVGGPPRARYRPAE